MSMYSVGSGTKGMAIKKEIGIFAEYTGLYGFIAKSGYESLFPDRDQGKDVFFQGSRQMDNFSRRYYEKELGAGIGPSPSMKEHFGYTEPFRRFVQREGFEPQANEIANTMPSWMPGDDYLTNFRVGDPYIKVDQGFARLPGAGYEAIHPTDQGFSSFALFWNHRKELPSTRRILRYLHIYMNLCNRDCPALTGFTHRRRQASLTTSRTAPLSPVRPGPFPSFPGCVYRPFCLLACLYCSPA